MKKIVPAFIIVSIISVATLPHAVSGQLISSVKLNEVVHADNDFPPAGSSTQATVTDMVVPFQKTVTANDGTGSMVTGTYDLADNGHAATFTISASGALTANGNDFGAGSSPSSTSFQFSQATSYMAQLSCNGSVGVGADIDANVAILYGPSIYGSLSASGLYPFASASGILPPGLVTIDDSWGIGYNDAPTYPASQSGTYSLTLTFTAIPEPSSALLIGGPAVALLARRRFSR